MDRVAVMTEILGKATATAGQMAEYLLSVNPSPQIGMAVEDFCRLYLDMAAKEGVRGDALFAQSCKETGNFNFRGTVKPGQNNFAGLGTTDPVTPGASFPDAATGILAQAQHAKAYATKAALSCPCVDPRYSLLIKYGKAGTALHWEELGGKWAVPGYDTKKYASLQEADAAGDSYGYQVIKILNKILAMPKEDKNKMSKLIALDAGHGMKTAGKRCMKAIDPNETREWWLNDRIMDRVEQLLAEYDCRILRVDDTTGAKDISMANRVKAANSAGADIYISMHHNAGLNGRAGGGTVVYYSRLKPELHAGAQRFYDAIVSRTGLKGNRSQKVIAKGFYVIKNTKMPAYLVENGFMDSHTDVPIILSAGHAEKTAQGVVAFLEGELGLTPKADGTQTTVPESGSGTPAPAARPLKIDSSVKAVQTWLNTYYSAGLAVDGSFGSMTKKALVKAWQREVGGLVIDGSFGTACKAAASRHNIRRGDKGILVTLWQAYLVCVGYDPNGIDGSFGAGCLSSTVAWQTANGLTPDGVVGSNTWYKALH